MQNIPEKLEPYFKIALKETDKSPCVRRKYAAMIVYNWYADIGEGEASESNPWHIAANVRVTDQCKDGCIRDRVPTSHAQNIERGAEIHAEQAVLIKAGIHRLHSYFLLVGKDKNGKELLGNDCLPCHTCAVMLKWAGYIYLYIKNNEGEIRPISITDIIEYREAETGALL